MLSSVSSDENFFPNNDTIIFDGRRYYSEYNEYSHPLVRKNICLSSSISELQEIWELKGKFEFNFYSVLSGANPEASHWVCDYPIVYFSFIIPWECGDVIALLQDIRRYPSFLLLLLAESKKDRREKGLRPCFLLSVLICSGDCR